MKRIYVNEQVCIGCGLCLVYCQVEHSPSKDVIKAFKQGSTPPLAYVAVECRGPVSFAVQCRHCEDAPCVYACLTGALQKDPDSGLVTVDTSRCIGCWTCMLFCPYGAVRQAPDRKTIAKCDYCGDREIPACVANCPNEALVYAEADDTVLDFMGEGLK